jgi:hypothetical protein
MSVAIDQDYLPAILARAFVKAWQSYYLRERGDTISEETARPALSKLLVAMAKEGVVDEVTLAAAGLRYLNSLTSKRHRSSGISWRNKKSDISDELPSQQTTVRSRSMHFRLDDVSAKFLPEWRVSLR